MEVSRVAQDLNDLKVTTTPVTQIKTDTVVVEVPAGKTFKVETTPDGEEILIGLVPVGKKWRVAITLSIVESDA